MVKFFQWFISVPLIGISRLFVTEPIFFFFFFLQIPIFRLAGNVIQQIKKVSPKASCV